MTRAWLCALALAGCTAPETAMKDMAPPSTMKLTSTAFSAGGTIPIPYADDQSGCANNGSGGGNNRSPPLSWSGAPSGTKSFAVFMEDLDFADLVHWMAWDLPATQSSLAENAAATVATPQGGEYYPGRYGGMCPPPGDSHRYRFTIQALSVSSLSVASQSSASEVRAAEANAVLGSAELTGSYKN